MAMDWITSSRQHPQRTAVQTPLKNHSYGELHEASDRIAAALLRDQTDLKGARVAFMVQPSFLYVAVQWAIWKAGGVAVPLALSYPEAELAYALQTAKCSIALAEDEYVGRLAGICQTNSVLLLRPEDCLRTDPVPLPVLAADRAAMILFTSGTTSRPKGVVISHANLSAQIQSLQEAWQWTAEDFILEVLPLHHTHGIVNVLCCALASGARISFLPKFDADQVLQLFREQELTLFMAVPTIYNRLIRAYEQASPEEQEEMQAACKKFRLMVSGSAALPVPVLEQWEEISGMRLLERYGMTEIGMALSNPYAGERRPGYVGLPLPGVEVRLVREDGSRIEEEGEAGEIQVKGPNVFQAYFERPEATEAAFTAEGWFRTGDIASLEKGYFRIQGRSSVDIIKSGGYKISALQIEEVLLGHLAIAEIAVVGIPDSDMGEQVSAAVVLSPNASLSLDEIRDWSADKLAPYKIPRALKIVPELPRNALGKIVKPKVRVLFGASDS